ncbi:MAG: hypothetical protein V1909_02115 [Candidatus Micrarchaeota archaeon]
MMPFPSETVRLLATGFVILGFLGVILLRGNSFKSKVMYTLLLFCLLFASVGVWYAISSVHILTELETYRTGRPVTVTVTIFGTPYLGGTFIYQDGTYSVQKASGFSFYRLDGSNWVELDTECKECVFRDCVDGKIEERTRPPPGQCYPATGHPYIWNQTEYVVEQRECAGKPYTSHAQKPTGPGQYKAEFCFGRAFNFDWDMPMCTPFQNVAPTCMESQFWIR